MAETRPRGEIDPVRRGLINQIIRIDRNDCFRYAETSLRSLTESWVEPQEVLARG